MSFTLSLRIDPAVGSPPIHPDLPLTMDADEREAVSRYLGRVAPASADHTANFEMLSRSPE